MRQLGRKSVSLLLALCLALSVAAPVQVFAEQGETPATGSQTFSAPTTVEKVTAQAMCTLAQDGATPSPVTFTTANIFGNQGSGTNYIYVELSGLPDSDSSWHVDVKDAAGNESRRYVSSDSSGAQYIQYTPTASGAQELTLTLYDSYSSETATYRFSPVTLNTWMAADGEMPAMTVEEMSNRFVTSAGYCATLGQIHLPADAPKPLTVRVVRDGIVYAGTNFGYNANQTAYTSSTSFIDPRYQSIFSFDKVRTACVACSPSITPIRALTPGSYDVVVLNAALETVYSLPGALTVVDEPIIDSINSCYSAPNVIGGLDCYVNMVIIGGNPADFQVSLYSGETCLGVSDSSRPYTCYNGQNTETYHIPLSAPLKSGQSCTARVTSSGSFSGLREGSVYINGSSAEVWIDSAYYADFIVRLFSSSTSAHASLLENNATVSETDFRVDENGFADVEFLDADGLPLSLDRNASYTVSINGKNTSSSFSFSLSGMRAAPSSGSSSALRGSFSRADGGQCSVTVYYPDTNAAYAAMTESGSYRLRLTNRLGEEWLLTPLSLRESSAGTLQRRDIFFDASAAPQAYYVVELLYDGAKLLDEDGKNILGANYDNSTQLHQTTYANNANTNRSGLYLASRIIAYNAGDGTVCMDGYSPVGDYITPSVTLAAARTDSIFFDFTQNPTPAQMREYYAPDVKVGGIAKTATKVPYYIVPKALLNAAPDTFTVSLDENPANGTVELISCLTGETVTSGSALPSYSEVYVRVVPDEGCQLPFGGIRVNGTPITGRAFLLTEDCTVSVSVEEPPAVYHNLSLENMSWGTVGLSASTAAVGSTVVLTPSPDNKYMLDTLKYRDASNYGSYIEITPDENGVYRFTMPDYDVKIAATFKYKSYYPVNGTVQNYGRVVFAANGYYAGDTARFTVTAYDHCYLESLAICKTSGENIPLEQDEDGSYHFVMPDSQVTTNVVFRQYPTYSLDRSRLNYSVDNALKLFCDGTQLYDWNNVYAGDELTANIAEDTFFDRLTSFRCVDGATGTVYPFTRGADGLWRCPLPTTAPGGTLYLEADTAQTYPISLDSYFYFSAYDESYYLTESEAMELLRPERADGTELTWDTRYLSGETVYIHAVPKSQYRVSSISYSYENEPLVRLTPTTDGRFCFTMPEDGVRLHVYVTYPLKYTAIVRASNASVQFVDGTNEYQSGSTVAFTASPNSGYRVTGVSVSASSGTAVSLSQGADGVYRFTMPQENAIVYVSTVQADPIVPGGVVTDFTSLMDALGGQGFASLTPNADEPAYVTLNRSVTLEKPLQVKGGVLRLMPYGSAITAPDGESALIVEDGAELCFPDQVTIQSGKNGSSDHALVQVNGGRLTFSGTASIQRVDSAQAPALRVNGGLLAILGSSNINGGASAAALEINGGSVRLEDGTYYGGAVQNGGKLSIAGGGFKPMTEFDSGLSVTGASAELTLCGGSFSSGYPAGVIEDASLPVTASITLPQGWKLSDVLGENCTLERTLSSEPLTEEELSANSIFWDVRVKNSIATYPINCSSYGNFTIHVDGELGHAAAGQTVTFTATALEGWQIIGAKVMANSTTVSEALTTIRNSDGSYSFVMPENGVYIYADTEHIRYPAPGGVVTDYASLMTALGGEENAKLVQNDTTATAVAPTTSGVVLKRHIALTDTLVFRGGNLTLNGAQHDLVAPEGKCAISVETDAVLTLNDTLRLSLGGLDKSEAPCIVSVSGGMLDLAGCSVYGSSVTRDAIVLSGGSLILRENTYGNSVYGGGTGCGLKITGGKAILFGGYVGGGSDKSATVAGAAPADSSFIGGDGIQISGGALELRGSYVNPGYPKGVALRVSGAPHITLFGGQFWCSTKWDAATQKSSIESPSVILPQGWKLSDLLAENCSITISNPDIAEQSVTEALNASEIRCAFQVTGVAATPASTPILPASVDKDVVQVAFLACPPADSVVTTALYDEDGRFLECAQATIKAGDLAVSLRMSGKSTAAQSAGIFLLTSNGEPMWESVNTTLDK